MSEKYFIGIRPQTNEHHTIHKAGCPFIPDMEKRIYLGTFESTNEALDEGKRHFCCSVNCRFCMKEHFTKKIEYIFAGITGLTGLPSSDNISAKWDSAYMACVN